MPKTCLLRLETLLEKLPELTEGSGAHGEGLSLGEETG